MTALDGVPLRLTRHRGGDRGPVLLLHGLGVSSRIFSLDTVETNLLEYLFGHGFDVWLLDFRASIDLPASGTRSNADDVATKDHPAAVAAVRDLTGAEAVHVVAHCYGSTTFVMAMLAGMPGVRSAVCSQIAAHVIAPLPTRVKSGLHLPGLLDALGLDYLDVEPDDEWPDRVADAMLRLRPTPSDERCTSPVCHRITFLYGPLYEHDRLHEETHRNLHELFGLANIESFEHLAEMVRRGRVVSAAGEDTYLPHLDRLAIPITFIHGAENLCFLPESTARTHAALSRRFGPERYARHVIPGYGHIDCIFGKDAVRDVYPHILEHLERTAG